jgi:uncharacterized membrane protein YfcA
MYISLYKGVFMDIKKVGIGVVTGVLNGLFGSGGGTVAVPAMEKFLGIEDKKAHATAIAVILPLSVVSLFIYGRSVSVDFKTVAAVSIGGVFGGYVGAVFLNKISGKWLHIIFGGFMIAAAMRMIL